MSAAEPDVDTSGQRRCRSRWRSPPRRRRGSSWHEQAACLEADPEAFYDRERFDDAKAVCATCPVREPCRDHALEHGEAYGVWGGLDEDELAAARRRRQRGHHDVRTGRPRRHEPSRACYLAGCRRAECRAANARYERGRHARGGGSHQ